MGVLKIDWENITRIYTKEEITARFSDKTMHQGFLVVEDGLGGCPRIGIFSQIEAFRKNKHSHMFDITSIVFLK